MHVAELLSGLWQITHKSNKLFGSEILLRCFLDDGTVPVALASDGGASAAVAASDDDDDDAASELLFDFRSVFLLSVDIFSVVYLFLSVIFLLKREKQANKII